MKKADRIYLNNIVEMGCIVCRNMGYGASPAEAHHLRSGVGTGQRSDHKRAIALCPLHHRNGGYGIAFHAGKKAWEEKYGTEEELLEQTHNELGVYA